MYPTVLKLGPWSIGSYPLLLALAIVLTVRLCESRAQRAGIDRVKMLYLCLMVILSGLVLSKVTSLILYPADERPPIGEFLKFWKLRGMMFYGGLIPAARCAVP
ncbi:MAG: prolipoprotein diacylglyceryl transferase family protein [Planctomycetota bacterium]|jgi:prolipoprotein diacylglyceryltransferase